MAKDPAFLFYPSDFLTGTVFMTNEEIGIYVKLLCAQHQQNGSIKEDAFNNLVPENSIIRSKFKKDNEGYYNQRLQDEMLLRQKKSTNLSANALKRWSNTMQKQCKSNAIAYAGHMPIEDENEDINKDYNIELLDKIKTYGQAKEIPNEICESYFHHYEKKNWLDGNGMKITNWKSGLINWAKDERNRKFKPEENVKSKNRITPEMEQMAERIRQQNKQENNG